MCSSILLKLSLTVALVSPGAANRIPGAALLSASNMLTWNKGTLVAMATNSAQPVDIEISSSL